ncbi:MAG: PD40 domain-containing protein [Bacteroidia bacterium]|nr:PD40 domain-containing protein [Bacteroidia bacterium]
MHKRTTIFLLLLTFFGMQLPAQMLGEREGKQIVNNKEFAWKEIGTVNFDVHYYADDPLLAEQVAKYAEEALYQVSALLDYRHKERFALWVYTHEYDLLQSNQFGRDESKRQGVNPLLNNSGSLVYPGSMNQLRATVRAEVAHLLLKEFYYGGGIQVSVQNQVLLHTPDWFVQGFSDFVGKGWTFEDEMYMSSLNRENLVNYAVEGNDYINRVTRKSIWFYISKQYGNEKLSEIFYMTRLTRSVEGGIITVLGITLKTLTERWREFMLGRMSANAENRVDFTSLSKKINLSPKDELISHAVNPVSGEVALFLMRRGKQRVEIYAPEKRTFRETGIKGGFATEQMEEFHLKVPMSWSRDGRFLLTMVFDNGFEKMTLYDSKNGAISSIPYQPMVDRVLGFDWTPGENLAIVSALKNGQVDLFYHKPGTNQFRQITDDGFDKLSPVVSPDGQYVYFSSNRDSIHPKSGTLDYLVYRNFLDIFRLDLNDKEAVAEPVTQTDEVNEYPLYFASSFELVFLSDEPGIYNLVKRNVFLGDVTRLTNVLQGFYQVSLSDSMVWFSTPIKGRLELFGSPAQSMLAEHSLNITDLRFLKHLAWQEMLKKEKNKDIVIVPEPVRELPTLVLDTPVVKPDSPATKEPVKFYVFDEEEDGNNKPDNRTKRPSTRSILKKQEKKEEKNFNDVVTHNPSRSKNKWASDYISTMVGFSPPWYGHKYKTLLNILAEVGISDLQGNHRIIAGIRPYLFNFKSSDFHVNYTYLKKRTDLFVGLRQRTRYLNTTSPFQNDFHIRYYGFDLNAGAIYPINRFTSISARTQLTYARRYDLDYTFPPDSINLDGADLVPGVGVNFLFDDTRQQDGFTLSGMRAEADLSANYSIGNKSMQFATLRLDLRKYTPVFGKIVLATRLAAGGSIGPNPQRFYMGGVDNMLSGIQNGADMPLNNQTWVSSFSFMDYITPMRGFLYNARNGSKYVAANAEFRIPISRMISQTLNSNPIYNLEFIPFFDIGTIWDKGNPLSQKNPINNDPIISPPLTINVQTLKSPFLIGFGSGVRFTLIGYSARADLAWGMEDYTIQKPRIQLSLGKNF